MDSTNKVLEDRKQSPPGVNPYFGGGVGLAHQKESEPRGSPEVGLHEEEVKKAVKEVGQRPNLTEEHARIGVQHAGESVPVDTNTLGVGKFPTILPTIEEVKENLTQPISNSARWLAELGRKILKRFRLWKGK